MQETIASPQAAARSFRCSWATRFFPPLCLGLLACGVCPGCAEAPTPVEQAAPVEVGAHFDPTTAGHVRGQVTWSGPVPDVPSFSHSVSVPDGSPRSSQSYPNPHTPRVDSRTRGVANAVVFLRDIDARRSRPWDHPAVLVEQRDHQLFVRQGDVDSLYGFVRRGDSVTMVSRQPVLHALQANGAAFFALSFPDPDCPLSRRLTEPGVVELSSAVGYYWARAYLFVADHPYYARTDAEGRFALPQVPAGRWELVCWLPNWHEVRRERDPEHGQLWRVIFHPPLQRTQVVPLSPSQTVEAHFEVHAELFSR